MRISDWSSDVCSSDLFGLPRDARTNIRVATSLAFADGSIAFGRPVQDSFAIVTAHESLGGAPVMVDPTGQSYSASTGRLGPALKPNLSAYSERTVAITSPDDPIGVDLGRGSFRLFPPYRSRSEEHTSELQSLMSISYAV